MPTRPKAHRPPRPAGATDGRASSTARGYGGSWPRLRRLILARSPVCQHCQRLPSVDVDHIVPIAQGGTYGEDNLEALCHSCHSRKTVRQDGGFGRKRIEYL